MANTDPRPPTGTKDPDDLVLVLQQTLEGCHRYQCFAQDARTDGDDELVELFEELDDTDRKLAERLKPLLVARLS